VNPSETADQDPNPNFERHNIPDCSLAKPADNWAQTGEVTQYTHRTHKIPTVGFVLSSDLKDVGIDLTRVPLDEVLDYRSQHGERYRAYARTLREFAVDLASASPESRERMVRDRTEEIADFATELRAARRSFARPGVAFAL
jgi:hypothetical protein